jgi:hypothetical protein
MNVELDEAELVARCVAIVVSYYHFARSWKDWVSIVGSIQSLSERFDSLEVSFDSIRPMLLVELSDRFDQETADRLALEFTDLLAFISSSSPAIVAHG